MRATEIIRNILDFIDELDCHTNSVTVDTPAQDPVITGVDSNRFKHIYAMLAAERSHDVMYDNSPNQVVANIDSVTVDAGGGLNGPKNPADIRADTVSMYPAWQSVKN